jgi:hypothetical protein
MEIVFLGNQVYGFVPKGFIVLSLSLGFDAIYDICEGKIRDSTNIETYDLMFKVQSRKAALSLIILVLTNSWKGFRSSLHEKDAILYFAAGLIGSLEYVK